MLRMVPGSHSLSNTVSKSRLLPVLRIVSVMPRLTVLPLFRIEHAAQLKGGRGDSADFKIEEKAHTRTLPKEAHVVRTDCLQASAAAESQTAQERQDGRLKTSARVPAGPDTRTTQAVPAILGGSA